VARNPSLKPWTGDNYEVSLEYYFKSGGVASAAAFRKDIADGFGTRTQVLDDALLAQFELEPQYRGWDLQTTFNIGDLVKINGIELNYQQPLTFLPSWARGFAIYGNTTILDIDGPNTAFSTLVDKTGNWGFSYSRGRFGVGLNWNYRSPRSTVVTNLGADGQTFVRSRITLDLNSEFRLNPRFSLFFNARNLTDSLQYTDRFSSSTPDYSRAPQANGFGVKMSAGIRGRF
jgi:iron complex outermembrane recepter protein